MAYWTNGSYYLINLIHFEPTMFNGIIVIMDIEWFFNFQTNVQKSSWQLTNKLNINIH